MPFDINKFKGAMQKHGGPARESLFEVQISKENPAQKNFNSRDLTFFCNAVTVPGIQINTADYSPVGSLERKFPQTMTNSGVSCTFLVDSDHEVLYFFHRWMQSVLNYGTKGGYNSEVDDRYKYEVGWKKDYACEMTIRHYSTESFDDKYYEWKFHNVWPTAIGDLDLAWNNNDSFLIMSAAFEFDNFDVTGEKTGTPDDGRRSRGGGLLDLLGRLGGLADTIGGIRKGGKPRSIQDAVNRVNRLRNSFDRVTDILG